MHLHLPALLMLCVWLTGCGFQPVYGNVQDDHIEVASYLSSIQVDASGGELGQRLENQLEDRLNPKAIDSLYGQYFRLQTNITANRDAVVVELDGDISRFNIELVSKYYLYDDKGELLDRGTVRRTASFNAVDEKFAAYVAEKEAVERALVEMSEDYRMRLSAYFAQHYKLGQRTPGA